jgi:hypothetical protein
MSSRRGYTIFCDDIRHEIGGKLTLVGVYRAEMLVRANLPVRLPKLGMMILFETPPDQPISSLELTIHLPGDPDDAPSFSGTVDQIKTPAFPDDSQEVDHWFVVASDLLLSPLAIKQEGYIRVRAKVEGETFRIGALRIRRASGAASPETERSA